MADTLLKLSGSTDGKGVKVAATATPGTLIHTAHATNLDVLMLWAVNQDADNETRSLTIEWGGVTTPDNIFVTPIAAKAGLIVVVDRLLLTNSLVVRAFADEADDVIIYGHVIRVS